MRVGAVGVTHVARDGDGSAHRLGIVEDPLALGDEFIGGRLPDLLIAIGERAVGVTLLARRRRFAARWGFCGGSAGAPPLCRPQPHRLTPSRMRILPPPL